MKARLYKIFSVLAVFFFCLTSFTAGAATLTGGEVLYLKPNSNWKSNARFAAYFCNGTSSAQWVSMTKVSGTNDIYQVTVPSGNFKHVIFCRMNAKNSTNSWTNNNGNGPFWNQTDNLTYDGCKDLYTVKEGTWDKGGGEWSGYNKYFITGEGTSSTWCNGKGWEPGECVNLLENNQITFSNLPKGDYTFKITNGTWSKTYGYSSNFNTSSSTAEVTNKISYTNTSDDNIKITTGECSDITVKFNPTATKKVSVQVKLHETKYLIMGSFDNWTDGIEITDLNIDNANEVMSECIEFTSDAQIKIYEQSPCGNTWVNTVKDGSVVDKPSDNNNITIKKGIYSFYYDFKNKQVYIGNATISKAYLTGLDEDILMSKEGDQYVLKDVAVKSTDKVKVKLVYECGNIEYVTLDDASCSTVESTNEGLTFLKDGYYDFYFKSDKTIYVGANESNPANADKYYLMGVDGDWDKADESNQLTQNPNDADELVLLGQKISQSDSKADAIKIVKKSICAVDEYYAEVKPSSTVIYTGGGTGVNPPNIVIEDGTYDFYFNKTNGKIYITGSIKNARVVYLDPKVENGSDWESDGARMAIYYFKSSNTNDNGWIGASYCDGYYYAYLPEGYDKYDWCRMNPDGENNWENRWNQTNSITYSEAEPLTKLKEMEKNSDQIPYNGSCGISYDNLDCNFPPLNPGDTLYVHINQFEDSDLCNYKFSSFEQAFAVLKNNDQVCTSSTCLYGSLKEDEITLTVPVVMLVHYGSEPYIGTEKVGMSGGHVYDAPAIFFRNINKDGNGHTLVVRTADPHGNRAVIVHPVIRRSTNIVLDNLDIVSDSDLRDNAIDIDNGIGMGNLEGLGTDYNVVPLPSLLSNITVKNCFVESYGRNCVHVSGMGGLHFENNEFYTKYDFSINPSEAADVVDWGGTIKFINSSDIKFLRNNSEGTLATSFFIQGSQRILIMNNVFWNDNAVDFSQMGNRTVANVRLVTYGDAERKFPLQNIGIYYNTFFCKDNEVGEGLYHTFDFFRIGGYKQPVIDDASKRNFDPSTIRFQYNNCYSYDSDVHGNNRDVSKQDTFYLQGFGYDTNWCQCFRYNNFWSVYDEDPNSGEHNSSNFEVGIFCTGINETYNSFVNVSGQVCKNDPANPSALVVTGDGLNIGTRLVDDVSGLGAGDILSDRLNGGVARPSVVVDNTNESLSPSDHIYREPGTINLFTSPLVGSHTNEVLVSSLALTSSQVTLSLVPGDGYDASVTEFFHLTNVRGEPIDNLTTGDGGVLDNSQIFITFVRPNNVDYDVTYEVNLTILPTDASEEQLILRIPIRGHYISRLRPMPGSWTVGAFQQREAQPVNTIIWHGTTSTEWDDRSNWYKEDGTLLTCLDALTNDLKVIIPRMDSEAYVTPPNGITRYPVIPDVSTVDNFKARSGNAEGQWKGEQVNAGPESNGKIADKIYLEYGASIQGVEYLGGISAYTEVEQEFIARRDEWLLVGTVVRPWNRDEWGNIVEVEGSKTRSVISGDYYRWHLPQVYMHEAIASKNDMGGVDVTWDKAFPHLDVTLPQNEAYAICIPDEYGPEYWTARRYNNEYGTNYNPEEPMRYTFTGRFYNEANLPVYEGLKAGVPVMLTNTYPANIDAVKFRDDKDRLSGTIQVYSYENQSFNTVDEQAIIQAQHSFVFTPEESGSLAINKAWLLNTEVTHRSAEVELPFMRIEMRNTAKKTASNVYIGIDENKMDVPNLAVDAPKLFASGNKSLPDLYVKRYDEKWAGVNMPTAHEPIPLGVRVNQKNQTFTISLLRTNMVGDILLEDRKEGKTYNLSQGETCQVSGLGKGECEGRFFINVSQDQDYIPDHDITTDVDNVESQTAIAIYTQGRDMVVSCTPNVELQRIIVTDMAGRHQVYPVSGKYVVLSLPLNNGIYMIQAIGDNAVKTQKVQIK